MDSGSDLGAFLRARRELVRPEDVGLPTGGTRRVPGLRREEVSTLAGISAEYYLRLERGRDRHPSAGVIAALARVLQLDAEGAAYLRTLAVERTGDDRAPVPDSPIVPDGVVALLDTLQTPAFVVDRYRDVLAANRPARALSPDLRPGANRARALFLDPETQRRHPDWESHASALVAQLRADIGAATDDPRARDLIGELSMRSPLFTALWARHDVARGGSTDAVILHPTVGRLTLRQEKLRPDADPTLVVVIYSAEPGTPDAEALATLCRTPAAAVSRAGDRRRSEQ
jgi:transcriptional regulator with XRE-family HTH domain